MCQHCVHGIAGLWRRMQPFILPGKASCLCSTWNRSWSLRGNDIGGAGLAILFGTSLVYKHNNGR